MDKYLSSTDVKAFPASWRSAESGDPESSLTTETSLRRLAYARFSHRSTAYFDTSSNEFVIVIDGYVFVVSPKAEESDPWKAAIGKIIEQFPDKDFPNISDIYAGIAVAAMGMTVGDNQYTPENGLFEQLRPSNSTNNALDSTPDDAPLDEGEPSLFYGLRLLDSLPLEPTGLSAHLHILHRDKLEDEKYGDWYIPEEAKFVTDTNQVQNRGGNVSIGTRLDTKEVYVTPSGEMSSEPTETPYSQLTSGALQVATSKASGRASRLLATARRISFSVPTDGGTSSASLDKSAESLAISDDAEIEVSAPTVSIKGGEGNSMSMSEGGPIEIVGANGITLDNSSESEPIEAKSAGIAIKAGAIAVGGRISSETVKVGVMGSLSVTQHGVFGTKFDDYDDASASDAVGAVSLFWNGMEYKAIKVSSSVLVPNLFDNELMNQGLMVNLGDSYRSFFLVQGVPLRGVYTSTGAVLGGLNMLPADSNYSQLWDLTFTFSPGSMEMWNCLTAGRLIGEWYGKAQDGAIKNVLDANGFPCDAVLNSSFSNSRSDTRTMTFVNLLDKQVRTNTVPVSTVNDWFKTAEAA